MVTWSCQLVKVHKIWACDLVFFVEFDDLTKRVNGKIGSYQLVTG
jgi:hypothetical protein